MRVDDVASTICQARKGGGFIGGLLKGGEASQSAKTVSCDEKNTQLGFPVRHQSSPAAEADEEEKGASPGGAEAWEGTGDGTGTSARARAGAAGAGAGAAGAAAGWAGVIGSVHAQ